MHGQLPKLLLWELKELQKLSLKEINKAEDPAAKLLEKKQNMLSCLLIPYCSQRGFVDEVILPQETAEN
jgi:hypothetical protein